MSLPPILIGKGNKVPIEIMVMEVTAVAAAAVDRKLEGSRNFTAFTAFTASIARGR
jgi:hypothetical protein